MESDWARFFVLAGIPDGIASRYASSFAANRVGREQVVDLDKATLVELGITAVGDQLAILKRAKNVAAMTAAKKAPVAAPSRAPARAPIAAPQSMDERFTSLDDRCASVQRRGKPPPDRDEIYHVKLPAGTTAKSRQILQRLEALKRSGIHPRGTTGVRKAGRTVLSIAEQRERETEVSSTTGGRVGGLHVDRLSGVRGLAGRVVKKRILSGGGAAASSGGLFGAAMAAAGTVGQRKKPLRVERAEGAKGRLPSVTVQLGNRVRMVGGGVGTVEKRVVGGGGARARAGALAGRVQGTRQQRGVIVEYEDELDEELMEDDMYEDEVEGDEVEYEDEEEEELVEYEDEVEEEMEEEPLVVGPASSLGTQRTQTRYVPVQQSRGAVRVQQRGGGQQRPQIHQTTLHQQKRHFPVVTKVVHTQQQTRRAPVVHRNTSIFDRIQF